MAEKEIKTILEREYNVPLRNSYIKTPYYKKTPKSVKALCEFIAKNMKVENRDTRKVKIDKFLNEYLWENGIASPKAKVKVKAKKLDNGEVIVSLVDIPEYLKYKMERENKTKEKTAKKKEEKKEKEQTQEEKKAVEEKKEALAEKEIMQAKEEHKEHKHESVEKLDKSPNLKKAIKSNSR